MENLIKDLSVTEFKEMINDAVTQAFRNLIITEEMEMQEDIDEYIKAKSFGSEPIPFEQAFNEIESVQL